MVLLIVFIDISGCCQWIRLTPQPIEWSSDGDAIAYDGEDHGSIDGLLVD